MGSQPLPPPVLVADRASLDRMIERLDAVDELAVDTEADSFYSYRDSVCLFQVSAGDEDWLVDPLADLDLAPLGDVLADPRRVKVFHDAEYDVLILKRDYGFRFANLFDTRVAAAVLGSKAPGLASVLEARFGVVLDKSQQRSNWKKRPLTEKQIEYARLDTRYLVELMRVQRQELEQRGRTMIVEAECRRLEALDPPPQTFEADDFARIKGARGLDKTAARALRELFVERESIAREMDTPPFRVLGNQAMIELARRRPKRSADLLRANGVTSKVVSRIGDRILAALGRARRAGPLKRFPTTARRDGTAGLDEVELELFERLKRVRKKVAEREDVEAAYVLNRHALVGLCRSRPTTLEELRRAEGIHPWQVELLGRPILDAVESLERDLAAGTVPGRRPWRR